ncbi:hypothetical protein [Clostridium polynesiense]|uniref:hypothetical protein n=1 Tax=Clostridium polynesiense TaxID=1325933 RepID=UPI00058F6A11|nr:hypothetical protein [Clostridium polynesiense]
MKIENKKLFMIISASAFILLIFVMFLFTYSYFATNSSKTYQGRVNISIKGITAQNRRLEDLIKDKTINVEKSLNLLPEILQDLSTIKDNLEKEEPSDKLREFHSNLYAGLSNNIRLYEQLKLSLENPNAKDIGKSFEALQEYRLQCVTSYEAAKYKRLSVELPKGTLEFIDNAFEYINEIIKLNRDSDIIASQKNEFIFSMDKLAASFNNINSDYTSALKRVREGEKNFDGIVNSIDKDIEGLVSITEGFNVISIPNNALEAYNSFKQCLSSYNKYIQEFRKAVTEESLKSKEKSLTENDLDILYENCTESHEELKAAFESFQKIYTNFKQK